MKQMLVALANLLLAPLAPNHAAEARRPNVLFLIVDDLTTTLGLLDPKTIGMPAFYQPEGENLSHTPKAALCPNNNVFRFQAPTPGDAREARRAYLASTAWVDSQVGRLIAKLQDDHESDPQELANLAGKPMQADRVQRMRSRLATHLRTAGGSAAAPVAKTPPVNQETK